VIIPHENEKDLVEISDVVKADLNIIPVRWIDEVLEVALTKMPKGNTEPDESGEVITKNKKTLADKPAARH
jgi:ATP-dependent Lon protease